MSVSKKHLFWFLIPAGGLVILDEWIKSVALSRFPDESSLTEMHVIDFVVHKNWGLAFDIPFRREFILTVSVLIGFFLLKIAVNNFKTHPQISFASLLIVIGALGNVFDRVLYGFTVDYIIVFGRSALNLCDIIILSGVVLLLIASRKQKKFSSHHSP